MKDTTFYWLALGLIFSIILVLQVSSIVNKEEKEPVVRQAPEEYITRVRVIYNEDGSIKKKLLFLQQI